MGSGPTNRVIPLTLVKGTRSNPEPTDSVRDVDWSILMARAQRGDAAAYRRLLDEVVPYLRSLVARQIHDPNDREDAVQDILLTVHSIRHVYDPTRPFGPWLATIAKHRLVDRLRHQGRRRARETALIPEHETFPGPQAHIDNELSDRREMTAALDRLPAGQRRAIQLLKVDELSLKEASIVSGMSIAALKVATHRALKNLREILSHGSSA